MNKDAYLGLRLPQAVLNQMDAAAAQMERDHPGQRVTRSDVARRCVFAGIPIVCGAPVAKDAPCKEVADVVEVDEANVKLDPTLEDIFADERTHHEKAP